MKVCAQPNPFTNGLKNGSEKKWFRGSTFTVQGWETEFRSFSLYSIRLTAFKPAAGHNLEPLKLFPHLNCFPQFLYYI